MDYFHPPGTSYRPLFQSSLLPPSVSRGKCCLDFYHYNLIFLSLAFHRNGSLSDEACSFGVHTCRMWCSHLQDADALLCVSQVLSFTFKCLCSILGTTVNKIIVWNFLNHAYLALGETHSQKLLAVQLRLLLIATDSATWLTFSSSERMWAYLRLHTSSLPSTYVISSPSSGSDMVVTQQWNFPHLHRIYLGLLAGSFCDILLAGPDMTCLCICINFSLLYHHVHLVVSNYSWLG